MTGLSGGHDRALDVAQTVALLRDALSWRLSAAGVEQLSVLIGEIRSAYDGSDAQSMSLATIRLAVLAPHTRFGSRQDRPEATEEPPHERINELIHHLTTEPGSGADRSEQSRDGGHDRVE